MSPMICVCLQRPVRRESLVQCVVCGEKGCKRHNKTDRKEALQVRCYLVYWTRPYTSPPLLSLSFLPPSLCAAMGWFHCCRNCGRCAL